jgi:hypothetical protein
VAEAASPTNAAMDNAASGTVGDAAVLDFTVRGMTCG